MSKLVSISIVTYNNEGNITKCLNSILKQELSTQIVVLDNASTDKTVEKVKQFKEVELIESEKNLGFGRGHNKAIEKAKREYVLILNPDTEILDQSLIKMLDLLESDKEIGLVAPKLVKKNGETQESVSNAPTVIGAFKEYFLNQKNQYKEHSPDSDSPTSVEVVYGAAMLLKKSLFDKLKGFDDRYFLYYEDLDFCRRVLNLGLKIIYYPDAKFKHLLGTSTKQIKRNNLPFGLRTIAHFVPNENTGSFYYQVQSGYIYHGILAGFLIRLIIYLGTKLGFYNR